MLVFLWQGNIKHLCDFLLWMDQITEEMVINRFLSPFLAQFYPIPRQILVINDVQVAVLLIIRNGPRPSLMTLLAF